MISLFRTTTTQKCFAVVLLVIFSFGVISSAYPHPAYAQSTEEETTYYDGPSFDELFEKYAEQCATAAAIDLVLGAVLSVIPTSVPTAPWPTIIKESIKDCLVSATKFALLELITGQAVGWAQRGYGGNPSFVQNISQYLLSIADSVAGSYIERTTAGQFLCSPFRAEIQLALTRYYQAQSGRAFPYGQSSCTLTGIASNVDAFLAGDFYSGGWESWIELSTNSYLTPYGAYLESAAALEKEVEEATTEAEKKLEFGSGFLSKETQNCYETQETLEDGTVVTFQECDPPQVVTPGETVKSSLEKAFGVKLDAIVAADELNEIISLVAVYLLTDVLTQDEGLTGYNYTEEFEEPLVDVEDPNTYPGGGGGQCTPTDPEPGTLGSSITYTPSAINDFFAGNIPLPSGKRWGDYRRVAITFDLTVGAWNGPGEQYNVVWLNRGGNDWGGGANRVIEVAAVHTTGTNLRAVTQVDSCTIDSSNRKSQRIALQPGETYAFTIDYEPGANRARLTVHRGNNQILSMNLDPTVDFLSSTNSENQTGYYLQLGAEGSVQGNEGNTDGWRWSDITVEFEPGN
ncbi:MAG: hypothetical protein AMXMBFR44_2660 [Candidatus Campbellbacteria bacterium]